MIIHDFPQASGVFSSMLRAALLWFFLLLCFPGRMVHAEHFTVLTENFPPFSYESDTGLAGYSVEVVKAIMAKAQIPYTMRLAVWDGAYTLATEQPNVLIFSMARTPAREHQFYWIGELASYRTGFYRLASRTDIQVESFEDLAGYRLSMLENGPAHQVLISRPDAEKLIIDADRDTVMSIDRMINRRADIVACPDVIIEHYLQDHQLDQSHVIMLPPLLKQKGLYLAASKQTDPAKVTALTDAYAAILASGTLDALQQTYRVRGPTSASSTSDL